MTTRSRGFTLVELLVVLAVIATLLSLAAPRFMGAVDASKEVVLRTNLKIIRDAIDKHSQDVGEPPERLEDLVRRRYLRSLPLDPYTESDSTWIEVVTGTESGRRLTDVHSSSTAKARDGTQVSTW